jgi:CheY-like chemotaxis protein
MVHHGTTWKKLGKNLEKQWQITGKLLAKKEAGKSYDVIILDWKMPGVNGVELTKKIREIAGKSAGTALRGLRSAAAKRVCGSQNFVCPRIDAFRSVVFREGKFPVPELFDADAVQDQGDALADPLQPRAPGAGRAGRHTADELLRYGRSGAGGRDE